MSFLVNGHPAKCMALDLGIIGSHTACTKERFVICIAWASGHGCSQQVRRFDRVAPSAWRWTRAAALEACVFVASQRPQGGFPRLRRIPPPIHACADQQGVHAALLAVGLPIITTERVQCARRFWTSASPHGSSTQRPRRRGEQCGRRFRRATSHGSFCL